MRFPKEAYADKDINGEIVEETVVVSNEALENHVKEYYIGNTKVAEGRRKDVRKLLEDKVVKRVGRKGKFIVDKLFELIEGVGIVQRVDETTGKMKSYYARPPSLNAIMYALDRVLGKPKQVNVQASFSLAKLLVETTKNNGEKVDSYGNRSNDNEEVSAVASILHRENLGFEAPADQGGM